MIDLYSDNVPNNAEIEAESLKRLNAAMPPRDREKLARPDLKALHASIDAEEGKEKADRDLLASTIELEHAEEKVAEPRLKKADYPDEEDEDGNPIENSHITRQKQAKTKAQAIIRDAKKAAKDLKAARRLKREEAAA